MLVSIWIDIWLIFDARCLKKVLLILLAIKKFVHSPLNWVFFFWVTLLKWKLFSKGHKMSWKPKDNGVYMDGFFGLHYKEGRSNLFKGVFSSWNKWNTYSYSILCTWIGEWLLIAVKHIFMFLPDKIHT